VSIGRIGEDGQLQKFEADGTRIKGFYYKNVHYEGPKIFEGFDEITKDVRNYKFGETSPTEIREAFALLYSMFADMTTEIKPENMREYKARGFSEILRKIGVERLVVGHNPTDKLEKAGVNVIELNKEGSGVIHIDALMSENYGPPYGKGTVLVFGPQRGARLVGFQSGDQTASLEHVSIMTVKSFFEFVRRQLVKQEKAADRARSVKTIKSTKEIDVLQGAVQSIPPAVTLSLDGVDDAAESIVAPWVADTAPEIAQTLVAHYSAGAADEEMLQETAVLNDLGGNSIVLMAKADRGEPRIKIGQKVVLPSRQGGGIRRVNVYAGTKEVSLPDGRKPSSVC
jgi:hypothetical protein